TQQIRSLGKPAPKRMCAEHLAEFEGIDDRQMPCRNSWCPNTWLWTRAAQLYQRERQEKLKPPSRLCDQCFDAEKSTEDREVACRISDCKHTWTWTREAQLRHRAWVGRQQAKLEAEDSEDGELEASSDAAPASEIEAAASEVEASGSEVEASGSEAEAITSEPRVEESEQAEPEQSDADEQQTEADEQQAEADEQAEPTEADAGTDEPDRPGKKRRRKRRRNKRKIHDGPPEKLCERCFARLGHLEPIEIPCKVHGCTNTWMWERDGQLRAWAALDG